MMLLECKELQGLSVFTENGHEVRITVILSHLGRVHLRVDAPSGVAVLPSKHLG